MVLLVGFGVEWSVWSGLVWPGLNLGLAYGTGLRSRVPVHVLKA